MGRGVQTAEGRFGARIRRERELRGWSQAEVANRLRREGIEVHYTTIAKIEARDAARPRSIRLDEAAALAIVFGTSLDELIGQHQSFDRQDAVDLLVAAAIKAEDQLNRTEDGLVAAFEGLQLSPEVVVALKSSDIDEPLLRVILAFSSYGATLQRLNTVRTVLRIAISRMSLTHEDLIGKEVSEMAADDFAIMQDVAEKYLQSPTGVWPQPPVAPVPRRRSTNRGALDG